MNFGRARVFAGLGGSGHYSGCRAKAFFAGQEGGADLAGLPGVAAVLLVAGLVGLVGHGGLCRGAVLGSRLSFLVGRSGLPQVDGVVLVEGAASMVHHHQARRAVDLPPAGGIPDVKGDGRIHQKRDDFGP